jgi:hypothetical protein
VPSPNSSPGFEPGVPAATRRALLDLRRQIADLIAGGGGGGGSDTTEWTAFTPTWTNLTPGNGVSSFVKKYDGRTLSIRGSLTIGSTTVMGFDPILNLPDGVKVMPGSGVFAPAGDVICSNGTFTYIGILRADQGASVVRTGLLSTGGTVVIIQGQISATAPFTWASGHSLRLSLSVPIEAAPA